MNALIHRVMQLHGFEGLSKFIDSVVHPEQFKIAVMMSSLSAVLAYLCDYFLGIQLPVGVVILLLFFVELWTGIKASKKEGVGFSSEKFGRGWAKLFVYALMVGCSNLLAKFIEVKPFFGMTFNIYEWLHYAFYNFVIIQLIISNLENFGRLGWGEYVGIIKKLNNWMNLNQDKKN